METLARNELIPQEFQDAKLKWPKKQHKYKTNIGAHLAPSQTSMVELFCKSSYKLFFISNAFFQLSLSVA